MLGLLAVCVLLPSPPPAAAFRFHLPEEESKSLWHQMAESMLFVEETDRDRFLDLCLRRRLFCDDSHFYGSNATFKWKYGVSDANKERFWRSYKCSYERDITLCPVDGGWSAWGPWSYCSATCDSKGNQTRTRTCTNPVAHRGGERCHGSLIRSRPCVGSCQDSETRGGLAEAQAYLMQVHQTFPDLMHDCVDSHCTYGVVQHAIEHKYVRTKYWSSLNCVKYRGACPVDGAWGEWSAWSHCSLQCGAGFRDRIRGCDSPVPQFGGHTCIGAFTEQQSCVRRSCDPASAETFTEWTKWSPCSVSCGAYGLQSSTRVCLRKEGCDLQGVLSPFINRTRPCYPGDCPKQGGWSEWSDWTKCSAACGSGRQSRLRLCDTPFPTGGLYCSGEPLEFRLCKGDNCVGQEIPPDAQVEKKVVEEVEDVVILSHHGHVEIIEEDRKKMVETESSASTPVKNSIAKASITNMVGFTKLLPRFLDEMVLVGKSDEYQKGTLNPEMEPNYIPWGTWSKCSASCGQGTRQRHRWCRADVTPLPPCAGEVRQVQFCNVYVCPVSGGWGMWLPWTPCTKTCGVGKRQRYRECNNPLPQFGGNCDGDMARFEPCDMGPCPALVSGGWSAWAAWSTCSKTCGVGQRTRHRSKLRPGFDLPDKEEATAGLDDGSREVTQCNAQPCPVYGSWADWGEWTRCNVLCGLGRRTRDRTCTDPFPVFGGDVCYGPGSDVTPCFAGPCKDAEDLAVKLGTNSWIRFAPRNRPTRFLVLYLHFKPTAPSGYLLRRHRQCHSVFDDEVEDLDVGLEASSKQGDATDQKADRDEKCQIVIDLKLDKSQVHLSVSARDTTLDISSEVTLSLGAWHEVLVEVLKSGASMRVNDHDRQYCNFSRTLVRDLDFDSYMSIGCPDNTTASFEGSIAALSVNFRHLDLFAETDWEGQGAPVGRQAISVQIINPSVQLPHFRGLYYSPMRLVPEQRLSIRVTLALDVGEGLLLHVLGEQSGTLLSLGFKRTRLIVCLICSAQMGMVCKHGDLLRLHQWYHISVTVDNVEVEVRVDQGKALQLTCPGPPFQPRRVLYVAGRSLDMWDETMHATNYTDGFFGVLGTLVVNNRSLSYRHAVLLSRQKRLNPDGYSRATRITPVFEHRLSDVTLHCEVATPPPNSSVDVRVIWLLSDEVLEPSEAMQISKPVGLYSLTGSLELSSGGHGEGIYACLVSRDGHLELAHVFPVLRHAAPVDTPSGNVEWVLLYIFLVLIPLLAIGLLLWRCRQCLRDLCNSLCNRKKSGLNTTPMEVYKPADPHLHGADKEGTWDNYLTQPEGEVRTVDVVNFGPTQERQLSLTPGVASERPLEVSEGQLQLSEQPRPTNAGGVPDPQGRKVLTTMTTAAGFRHVPAPYDNLDFHGEALYEEPVPDSSGRADHSHNRSPPPDHSHNRSPPPDHCDSARSWGRARGCSAADLPPRHGRAGLEDRYGSKRRTVEEEPVTRRRDGHLQTHSMPALARASGTARLAGEGRRCDDGARQNLLHRSSGYRYPSPRRTPSHSACRDGQPGPEHHQKPGEAHYYKERALRYQHELQRFRGHSRERDKPPPHPTLQPRLDSPMAEGPKYRPRPSCSPPRVRGGRYRRSSSNRNASALVPNDLSSSSNEPHSALSFVDAFSDKLTVSPPVSSSSSTVVSDNG